MNNNLKNILIVDDSNITRNLIEHVYNSKYNVVTAVNGKEAVNYINTVNIDTVAAILLDLNMPEVDGFEVLDNFKERGILSKVPVCIITGEEAPEIIGKVRTYNVAAILLKPFSVSQIEDVVTKAIELRKNN